MHDISSRLQSRAAAIGRRPGRPQGGRQCAADGEGAAPLSSAGNLQPQEALTLCVPYYLNLGSTATTHSSRINKKVDKAIHKVCSEGLVHVGLATNTTINIFSSKFIQKYSCTVKYKQVAIPTIYIFICTCYRYISTTLSTLIYTSVK